MVFNARLRMASTQSGIGALAGSIELRGKRAAEVFVVGSAGAPINTLTLSAMDLKFALRSLGKNPGFTVLALVVMAFGIGANTAVLSVVNAVLLKPLAYHDPDRIVTLFSLWKEGNSRRMFPSSSP